MEEKDQFLKSQMRSLIFVEERLLEADYFLEKLFAGLSSPEIDYYLNAFISSCRATTLILQKEMNEVKGFDIWWKTQQEALSKDKAAKFFLDIRNHALHAGRVGLTGAGQGRGKHFCWRYYFAGGPNSVPQVLLFREISGCCQEHLSRLAKIILNCMEEFPFNTCYKKALTPEGVKYLNVEVEDVLPFFGFPKDWFKGVPEGTPDEGLSYLRREADGVNVFEIQRISELPKTRKNPDSTTKFDENFSRSMIKNLENREHPKSPSQIIGEAIIDAEKNKQ